MKKKKYISPVLMMVSLIFIAGCVYEPLMPVKGDIFLREPEKRYELGGEWEFYWGKFYLNSDFTTNEAAAEKKYIDYRTNWCDAVINGVSLPELGYATYRLKITIPRDNTETLFLRVPYFDMAIELYCNSKLVFTNGKAGKTAETSEINSYYPTIMEAEPVNGIIELVIHASNFKFPRGGISDSIIIGSRDNILWFHDINTSIEMIFIGSLLIMSIYNLILFFLIKRKITTLYFSIICLSSAVYMMVNGTSLLGKLGLQWEPLSKVYYISWLITAFFFLKYFTAMFEEYRSRALTVFYTVSTVTICSIILFTEITFYNYLFYPIRFLYFALIIYALAASVIEFRKKNENAALFLSSLIVIFILMLIDSIPSLTINQFNTAAPAGLVLFCMIQSVLIGKEINSQFLINNSLSLSLEKRNRELKALNSNLEKLVSDRTEELKQQNETICEQNQLILNTNQALEKKIKKAVEELRSKDDMLTLNSRQASMGEMIGFIGHQWKQNIYAISLYSEALKNILIQKKVLDTKTATEPLQKIDSFISEMYNNLNDFNDFIKPGKEIECFSLTEAADQTLYLMSDFIKINSIEIIKDYRDKPDLSGFSNELKQVIMNMINNSTDAFNERDIKKRTILISVYSDNGINSLVIKDNAGGIHTEPPEDVFDKFHTSKRTGMGLGLYISKIVIEQRFKGRISVNNTGNGAVFTISFPVSGEDIIL